MSGERRLTLEEKRPCQPHAQQALLRDPWGKWGRSSLWKANGTEVQVLAAHSKDSDQLESSSFRTLWESFRDKTEKIKDLKGFYICSWIGSSD